MIPDLIHTFRHELVSTILVTAFIGVITMPFRKVMQAYKEAKAALENISNELLSQRTNCLNTLQNQGEAQITLLTQIGSTLQNIQLDNREMLTHLRDKL
jgi:hypothetical protein